MIAQSSMKIMKDLVSVIIPVHNRPDMLVEAVNSVLEQSYRPIEIIIVDDGSTDTTVQVCDELQHRHPDLIQCIHVENGGAGSARQYGLGLARGEYIQYLDSDDLLLADKLRLQVAGLEADTDAGISYGLTIARDESGSTEPTHGTELTFREIFPRVLQARLWATATPIYRRAVCDAIGPWSKFRLLEDWDYECRAGLLGIKLHYCPETLAVIRRHEGSHAGRAWLSDQNAMRDRAAVYEQVFAYAKQAGVPNDSKEMRFFARASFHLSRQCGAAGLTDESARLFNLARIASGTGHGLEFSVYRLGVSLLGWKLMGRLSQQLHRLRG